MIKLLFPSDVGTLGVGDRIFRALAEKCNCFLALERGLLAMCVSSDSAAEAGEEHAYPPAYIEGDLCLLFALGITGR